jgi:hypothetical protein
VTNEQASDERAETGEKRKWGGARKGAGRKPGVRPKQQHVPRPVIHAWKPVLVTVRRAEGVPSLRSDAIRAEVDEAARATKHEDFRIVYYAVQADHLRLLVEADSSASLAAGMKSFGVRSALFLNFRVLNRQSGRVWGDRYHQRELSTPRQVRDALVDVIGPIAPAHTWLLGHCSPARAEASFIDGDQLPVYGGDSFGRGG